MRLFASQQLRRAIVVSALLLIAAATGLAAPNAPSKATVNIRGGTSFRPNEYIKDAVHFAPATTAIQSGGTITVSNLGSDREGHSLSLVKKSDVPRTLDQVNNCAVCNKLFKAHGIDPNGPPLHGPPPHLIVNVGAPGFDTPGDSIVIGPKGTHFGKVTFKVTAKPGTTLYFMCMFHPWMQGRFLVR